MFLPLELVLFRRVGLDGFIKGVQISIERLYIKAYGQFKPTYRKVIWGCRVLLRGNFALLESV
jgi:hypothetical protein